MADEIYATLADLKKVYKPEAWTTEAEEEATDKLATASAMIRQTFRNKGLDFNQRIADGKVETFILKEVICVMVRRALTAAPGPLAGMDLQSISQGAGPWSTSITPTPGASGGSLYFKKAELEMLGCPTIVFGSVDLRGGLEAPR